MNFVGLARREFVHGPWTMVYRLILQRKIKEGSHSGLVRRFAKPVYGCKAVSRVRIPPPPTFATLKSCLAIYLEYEMIL